MTDRGRIKSSHGSRTDSTDQWTDSGQQSSNTHCHPPNPLWHASSRLVHNKQQNIPPSSEPQSRYRFRNPSKAVRSGQVWCRPSRWPQESCLLILRNKTLKAVLHLWYLSCMLGLTTAFLTFSHRGTTTCKGWKGKTAAGSMEKRGKA